MKKFRFYSLNTILCLSTLFFSGCRFGNHSESAKPLPTKDSLVDLEYFTAEPKNFETKATYYDASGNLKTVTNATTPLSAVPEKILGVFTQVHIFANYLDNNQHKIPIFANYERSNFFETFIENGNQIAYEDTGASRRFMYKETCTSSVSMTMEGIQDRTHPTTLNIGGGEVIKIAGHTNINIHYSRRIDGDCADDLYLLAYCYSNGSGCNTDELQFSHDILDLHVNQSGVLNINDVLKLKTLEYTVHLE